MRVIIKSNENFLDDGEQYNNIISPRINNFTQRLVVDCTLMRVTSDLSH